MEYQKNREIYKPVTLRIKRTDADVMQWLEVQKSVNASIMRLIRDEIERTNQTPTAERLRQYELIEQNDAYTHHVLGSYDALEDALRALVDYVQAFTPAGRVYVSERFTGILPNGKKIKASKIIKAFEEKIKEENKMLNNVSINGRLVKGIMLEQVTDNVKTRFTVACNRDYKDKDGRTPCDFIDCVAWNAPAHFLEMYANKGDMLAVSGRLQKDTWKDSEGNWDSRTYVQVSSVNIVSRSAESEEEQTKPESKKKTYARR